MTEPATHMEHIEQLTQAYAARRDELAGVVEDVQHRIEDIKRRAMPRIKQAVRDTAEAKDALQAAIEAHPDLWNGKRRTVVIAGVRVGMMKGSGKIVWDDAAHVVKLIRRQFPDRAESMIRVREEPIRKALGELSVSELRKIGCTVEDSDDQVVIKPTDSAVDKLVNALMADAERIEGDDA